MGLRLNHIGKFIDILKMFFSIDTISKLKNNTKNYINNWIGRVAHYRREIKTKRLQNRQHRLYDNCKIMKRNSCKCNCNKCININSINKQRVTEVDLLKNYSYQRHPQKERPSMLFVETQTNNEINIATPREDHRDLQQTKCNGVAWWNDMTHRVFMPPLLQQHSVKPTHSECSIISDYSTDNTEIHDAIVLSRNSTPSSEDSDYKSCRDVLSSFPIRIGSKSDSKIPESIKIKLKSVAKSVSIPLGQQPRKLRGTKIVVKRKLEMKRPVRKTTSHTTDCCSNCVKCSRIVSRPYKKIIH